jgi:salicylate hydroxylase
MQKSPVSIAGAGIAGLAVALALGKRDAVLLEQAQAFSEVGASLQLGPNAVRALQKLGAWDAVSPITSSPPEIHMRDGKSGQLLKRLKLGAEFEQRFGAPYRVARRADLHAALLSCVEARKNLRIRFNATLTSARNLEGQVAIAVNDKTESTPVLIATDGVKSKIRETMFAGAQACDAGMVFHRGQSRLQLLPGIDLACVNVWLYPQGHVVQYPAGIFQQLNIVAITPKGFEPDHFFNLAARPLQEVLASCEAPFTQWPALYVNPLSSWTEGGILLLGDAAHGTLPYLAQGAAMALEDAAALQAALSNTPSVLDAFHGTQNDRLSRARKLHAASLAAGKIYHQAGVMRMARNMVLRASPHSLLTNRMAWIYEG